jgi:hypothetical protein
MHQPNQQLRSLSRSQPPFIKKKTRPSRAAPEVGSTTHWSQQTTTSPFRLLPVAPRFRRRYPAISATATRCRRRRSRREDRYRCRRQINWTCKTRACATCGCGVPEALFCQDSASFVAHVCDLRALLRFWGVSANC